MKEAGNSEEVQRFTKVLNSRLKTFVDKNMDYGSSFRVDGLVGVIIRMGDKLMRMKKITQDGYSIRVKDESLMDTLADLSNYADMATMLLMENNNGLDEGTKK